MNARAPASPGLANRLADWIDRRDTPRADEVVLDRRHVYIVPTRPGLFFGLVLLALLIGSINYQLQLGFLLTFLIASVAVVGMHMTHRNLLRTGLRGHHVDNVFAGEVAAFDIAVSNPTEDARHALRLYFLPRAGAWSWISPSFVRRRKAAAEPAAIVDTTIDVPARGLVHATVGLTALARGKLACPRICIETRFPFGLWRAWGYATPALRAVVYPRPEADGPPLPAGTEGEATGLTQAGGGDDFAGVRPYQAGDPHKMIAWRLAARSDALAVKLFEQSVGGQTVLDYGQLPASLDVEQRLSRLARWVLEAEAAQLRYALRLPGTEIPAGRGAAHRARCLTALALYRA